MAKKYNFLPGSLLPCPITYKFSLQTLYLASCIFFISLVVSWYTLVYRPIQKKLQSLHSQKTGLITKKDKVHNLQQMLLKNKNKIEKELQPWNIRTPKDHLEKNVMASVHQLQMYGLNLLALQPEATQQKNIFHQKNASLSCVGTYDALIKFLEHPSEHPTLCFAQKTYIQRISDDSLSITLCLAYQLLDAPCVLSLL